MITPKIKAKLVAKGFREEYDVDFDEIFSLLVKMTTLRFMLGVVAVENLELILDSVFLRNREEKDAYEAAPQRVKSVIEVSQSAVLRLVIVATRGELSLRHPTQSCFIHIDDIRIGHSTLFSRSL